jgi:hypothetical protein
VTNAIMLLPTGFGVDSTYARHCLLHIERRGYELAGIVHDWDTAIAQVRADEAEVVVLAREEHFDPGWTPRIEYVGEETRDLPSFDSIRKPRNERAEPGGEGRNRRPGPVS